MAAVPGARRWRRIAAWRRKRAGHACAAAPAPPTGALYPRQHYSVGRGLRRARLAARSAGVVPHATRGNGFYHILPAVLRLPPVSCRHFRTCVPSPCYLGPRLGPIKHMPQHLKDLVAGLRGRLLGSLGRMLLAGLRTCGGRAGFARRLLAGWRHSRLRMARAAAPATLLLNFLVPSSRKIGETNIA